MNQSEINQKSIRKAILKSQHCQRNFDLSQEIPRQDIELMKTAVAQCPSKQNLAYYKAYFVFDREIIEKIHTHTKGFGIDPKNYQTNSQVLANLLVVFTDKPITNFDRNEQAIALGKGSADEDILSILKKDMNQALGIAAGYLNLTASLLGYSTGCCACFDEVQVKSILGEENTPLLLMGIGFRHPLRNRRQHHKDKKFIFPTFQKEQIEVHTIGQQEISSESEKHSSAFRVV